MNVLTIQRALYKVESLLKMADIDYVSVSKEGDGLSVNATFKIENLKTEEALGDED